MYFFGKCGRVCLCVCACGGETNILKSSRSLTLKRVKISNSWEVQDFAQSAVFTQVAIMAILGFGEAGILRKNTVRNA